MAEQIYTEQFGNVVAHKVCTTSIELNFDNYRDPGKYDIYEEAVDGRVCVHSLIVDHSPGAGCVKQTRIHEGLVDTRCDNGDGWTEWELVTGSGGGVSPKARVDRVQGGAEITVTDEKGTTKAKVNDGEDGGYYVPNAIKTAKNSVTFGFNPSRSGMASVPSVKLEAPAGGYYTPEFVQTEANQFDVNFSASKEGMPEIEPVTLTFPVENFVAVYNQTTWAELTEAVDLGKHIYARAGTNIYVLFDRSSSTAKFSRAQQGSIDYLILNSGGFWSSSSVKIVAKEDFDALVARVAALEG